MNSALWVVIPSAGKGRRFGASTPKQYQTLLGKTVLQHTLDRFLCRDDVRGIVLAVSGEDFQLQGLPAMKKVMVVEGGEDRADSVYNALLHLQHLVAENDLVAVHDAARPCVRQSSLDELFLSARNHDAGAILALPATDTVKWVEGKIIEKTMDREHVFLAQTPQVFRYKLLKAAMDSVHSHGLSITDEASAVELAGVNPAIVCGRKDNIKITTADDLGLAAFFLKKIQKEND